ncbi:MAG: hypothetical protein HRK26_02920 [Rickettsiaceae bacterium H1]|nr:hypothetical protein [Rickettsiaceae bacterium H1]
MGTNLDDMITVNFKDIGLEALYRDDKGSFHTKNNISSKESAEKSFEAIENALEHLKSEIAIVGSATNQFISVDKKLSGVIDSMSEAISNLMNISLPEAAADYAAESLKLQAATTAHNYHNTIVKDLVSSILRG